MIFADHFLKRNLLDQLLRFVLENENVTDFFGKLPQAPSINHYWLRNKTKVIFL